MPPRALLFDFDGVILDTEWAIYQTWLRTYRKYGHDLPLETYVQCIGSDFETWSPEVHLQDLTGRPASDFDWPAINEARNEEIRRNIDVLDAMPGVRDLLTWCSGIGLPCAVVSSSSHSWVDHWLHNLDLTLSFRHIICRGDAPRIKPAPDLYQEAVRRFEFPAADCLVIEDSLNGMRAAHAAGCPVVAVPNRITSCIDFSKAEFQHPDLYGLLDQLSGS